MASMYEQHCTSPVNYFFISLLISYHLSCYDNKPLRLWRLALRHWQFIFWGFYGWKWDICSIDGYLASHKQLMGLGCGWFGGQVRALGSCYCIWGLERVHYPALLGVLVHPVSIDFITSNSRAKKKYFLNNFLSLVLINEILKKQLRFN